MCDGYLKQRCCFFLMIRRPPRSTLFPTRRSSDLQQKKVGLFLERDADYRTLLGDVENQYSEEEVNLLPDSEVLAEEDRKSTRLNSSHSQISYAVFCLKKKK